MKWMLIVLVMGGTPVKTGLLFESIDKCLRAEEAMRGTYAQKFNEWHDWALQNVTEADYPKSQDFMMGRIGTKSWGTCIPHADLPPALN